MTHLKCVNRKIERKIMVSPTTTHDQKDLVVQSNALTHSRQSFTVLQNRIMTLAMMQIQRSDNGDEVYQIRVEDLVSLGTSRDIFNRLDSETRSLAQKVVTYKDTL